MAPSFFGGGFFLCFFLLFVWNYKIKPYICNCKAETTANNKLKKLKIMEKLKNKKDTISSIKKYIKSKGYPINSKNFTFEIKPFIGGCWNGDYCNIEHWYKEAKNGAFDLKLEIAIYSHFCPIWNNPKHELAETLFNIPKNIYLK